MVSILTRRLSGAGVVFGALLVFTWLDCRPLPWAEAMARESVDSCYAGLVSGAEPNCAYLFRTMDDTYGRVKSYRIASVERGFRNTHYTVTVNAEREKGRTREAVFVFAAYIPDRDEKTASMQTVDVEPR